MVKDIEKYYKLDKDYKVSTEVNIINSTDKGTYFYDHHGPAIYYNSPSQECTLVKANTTASIIIIATIDKIFITYLNSKNSANFATNIMYNIVGNIINAVIPLSVFLLIKIANNAIANNANIISHLLPKYFRIILKYVNTLSK